MAGSQNAMRGTITVVLTLVGWSAVPLFIFHFTDSMDFWTQNGWRYAFAALLWISLPAYLLVRGKMPRGILVAALVPAFFNCCGQTTFCYGFYRLDPGLITFGLRLQIAFVALGAFLLFPSERAVIRSRGYLFGLLMVFGGSMGTLLLGDDPLSGARFEGIVAAVAAGFLFASYALSVRKFMSRYPSVLSFAVISQYTAAVMVLFMLLFAEDAGMRAHPSILGWEQFGLLMLSSVIGIALGHVFYYISIADLGVAVSAGVIQLQPFCVAALSFVFFGEQLTAVQWGFGVVAITGAMLMLLMQRRISRRQLPEPFTTPVVAVPPEPMPVTQST